MLSPNDMKVLEDMRAEVRAMTERERNVLFSSLKERLPEKMLALMNANLLDAIQALLGQLIELNKGEFKTFVELYPTLWVKLGISEPFVGGPSEDEKYEPFMDGEGAPLG